MSLTIRGSRLDLETSAMRNFLPMAVTIIVFAATPAFARNFTWTEYVSRQDFFSVNFPGEPSVEEFPYPTEYRVRQPGWQTSLHRLGW